MADFTDDNQVTWNIRTTSVRLDDKAPKSKWFAVVSDDSKKDYSGNQFPLDESETFPGVETTITWPAGGNPFVQGQGGEAEALAFVKAFAAREGAKQPPARTIATRAGSIRVTGSSEATLAILIVAALVILSDKRRR